jgi:uncharacterized radical SAM protein YgiQ
MPSILVSSNADLLVYGMGEKPLSEIIRLVNKGVPVKSIRNVSQTAFIQSVDEELPGGTGWNDVEIASHEDCLADKKTYSGNFKVIEEESNKWKASRIVQKTGNLRIVINPPFPPMEDGELDKSFDLPYTRLPHPRYEGKGAIPAFEMIKFSVNTHRGCFGGCTFCTISAHQGKFIASRSMESILKEVEQITLMPDFKGYISDMGGPSANMYKLKGKNLGQCERCRRPSCIYPTVCSNLDTDHTPMLEIYSAIESMPGIKKAFVGSGIRYDMLLNENASEPEKASHKKYIKNLVEKHVSGRLKVAPEHTTQRVLNLMRKPSFEYFKRFKKIFDELNRKAGLKQQIIPYFISSHPGSTEEDMASLAIETKEQDFRLEQVQDFTPTPMTMATEIYYSGYNPYSLEKTYTARTREEKQNQQMFFFWYKSEFRKKIADRLAKLGKSNLAEKLFSSSKKESIKKTAATSKKEFQPHWKKYKKQG